MRRRRFLSVTAAALSAAASAAIPGVAQADDEGIDFPDLRWGHLPLPPSTPGYDPVGDAQALVAPGTVSPAPNPIPGVQLIGSYAPNQRFVMRVPANWNGRLVVAGTPAFGS